MEDTNALTCTIRVRAAHSIPIGIDVTLSLPSDLGLVQMSTTPMGPAVGLTAAKARELGWALLDAAERLDKSGVKPARS